MIGWFATRRKALVPFVPALLLIAGFYLNVQPAAAMAEGTMWYTVIGLVLTALGVHTVTNDGTLQAK